MSLAVLENDSIVYEALSQLEGMLDTENIGVDKDGRRGIDRDGLVKLTGLPRTTVYDALIRLIRKKLVEKFSEERDKRGRPKIFFA